MRDRKKFRNKFTVQELLGVNLNDKLRSLEGMDREYKKRTVDIDSSHDILNEREM